MLKVNYLIPLLPSIFFLNVIHPEAGLKGEKHNKHPYRYQEVASLILSNQKSRISDAWGKGLFLASRDGGNRTHKGLDIVAKAGEKIFMPFEGTIVKEAVPYGNDLSFKGLVIKGSGDWIGYELKVFYVNGLLSGKATKGQEIGTVQDLFAKYPGITNHIHVEVKKDKERIDPFEIWKMSF